MRTMTGRLRVAASALLLAGVGVAAAPPLSGDAADAAPRVRPNVVVIITDDQPQGTLDVMPNVRKLIMGQGADITNGIIPTSLCCPSRASLLTGQPSRTTNVWTNKASNFGAWPAFQPHEDHTLATALRDRNYRTGLFGKYMNGWNGTVPQGWEVFRAFGGTGDYFDYRLVGTGDPVEYGSNEADYSTDVLADLAEDFLASSARPAFLWFAPFGPQGPLDPAPRHVNTLPLVDMSTVPAFNEGNISDKPKWVHRRLVDETEQQQALTRQRETLLSVDEAVGRLVEAAGDEPTIFVYLSDNGFMNGSHRLTGKDYPYDRSVRVPMGVRYTGVIPRSHPKRIVTNTDLTATILDVTGADLPDVDGVSLLSPRSRRFAVIEQVENQTTSGGHPAYCGIRTTRYLYVEYDDNRGRELYDYRADPEELRNLAGSRRYRDVLHDQRDLARKACKPRPPGFNWD